MRSLNWILTLSLGFLVSCAAKEQLVIDYSSPEKTFETWRQAVIRLDTKVLVESYVRDAQPMIRKEISDSSQGGLEATQAETKITKFHIEKIVYQQNKAFVRVRRELNNGSDIEVLTMLQEEGEWRLVP